MKAIDFTQPGGFPLTQDQLDHLQNAYTESTLALAAAGHDGSSAPVIISGMISSPGGGGSTNVSAGWLLYNNELIRFPAATYGVVTLGNVPLVTITPTAGSLTYNDGSTPAVILDKTASVSIAPAITDAAHFPFGNLLRFGQGFGINNREQFWQSMVVSTAPGVGGVTGTVYYKKDFTANTMQIRGFLTANDAQNFAASPAALFSLMGTLPAGYIPNNTAYFIAHYFVAGLIKDDLGISWIKQVNCVINTGGQILINWLKPDVAITAYAINFNAIVPLD